jgi:hypothetical protein
MYTQTSKGVLEPLADGVASLVVLLSEGAQGALVIPDLVPLGQAVREHVGNLAGVARRISDKWTEGEADSVLRAGMRTACETGGSRDGYPYPSPYPSLLPCLLTCPSRGESYIPLHHAVLQAGDVLAHSSVTLTQRPGSAEGRAALLDALRDILQGTTAILDVFDAADTHRILQACEGLLSLLEPIRGGVVGGQHEAEVSWVAGIHEVTKSVLALSALVQKRAKELLAASHQASLEYACRTLTEETPLLVGACRVCLLVPGPLASEALVAACDRLAGSCYEIERVIKLSIQPEESSICLVPSGTWGRQLTAELVQEVERLLGAERVDIRALEDAGARYQLVSAGLAAHTQGELLQIRLILGHVPQQRLHGAQLTFDTTL